MSGRTNTFVSLKTLAELGEAFALDDQLSRPSKEKDPRHGRVDNSPPIIVSPDCGLCGEPLLPGRYVCVGHARRALEAAHVYRQKHHLPGHGRVWMTDNQEQENHVRRAA